MRPVDHYLDLYSADHRNATNQWIHLLCVPPIVWTVTAMLWTIPGLNHPPAGTGMHQSRATTLHRIAGTAMTWMRWLIALRWSPE